jgi:hypothetical protein
VSILSGVKSETYAVAWNVTARYHFAAFLQLAALGTYGGGEHPYRD